MNTLLAFARRYWWALLAFIASSLLCILSQSWMNLFWVAIFWTTFIAQSETIRYQDQHIDLLRDWNQRLLKSRSELMHWNSELNRANTELARELLGDDLDQEEVAS